MTIYNGLGCVTLDMSNPATGTVAPVFGESHHLRHSTFMSMDHNKKSSADTTTTINHLSNVTPANGTNGHKIYDKSTLSAAKTKRGDMNLDVDTHRNLKGSINTTQFLYMDGAKTTTKETILYSWNGGATTNVQNQMTRGHYTSGGSTNIPVNKNLIIDYIPGGSRVTGNMTQVSCGQVNFKNMDNDKIRTEGQGTLFRATPEMSRINQVFKEQSGTVQFNPNRTKQEDHTRTDSSLIQGLLTNGFSIYNNGKKDELVFPSFICDSRPADYSPYKITQIKKEKIQEQDITHATPVHNSKLNGNEIIVRNVTSDNIENPLLFTKRELIRSPSIHGRCYSGDINSSGLATNVVTKDTTR